MNIHSSGVTHRPGGLTNRDGVEARRQVSPGKSEAAQRRACSWAACYVVAGLSLAGALGAAQPSSTWPQAYSVQTNREAGALVLETPYYRVEHDLKKGGAISRIQLRHGRAANLLRQPVEAQARDAAGAALSDAGNPAAKVAHRRDGLHEIVTVEGALMNAQGQPAGIRVKSTYRYGWGYVKVRREFISPAGGVKVRELSPLATVLAPSLTDYGYREGKTEEEGAPPFDFGSNRWGKVRPGNPADRPLAMRYVPRSMIFVDPGVEGLEWFVSSDLAQWDLQLAGRRGQGRCALQPSQEPAGLALSISPWSSAETNMALPGACSFDFYLAFPLIEGHAQRPWMHTSFNRNKGNWVGPAEVARWAETGIQTVHCHNDGDYYDDGLFWRDGSYPPYPDMDRYDQVLRECRKQGIRTATYFSDKELHPSTKEFQQNGQVWGRKNRKGNLQHNMYKANSEFGAQMCLRSGWLEFLKLSIDRVLKNHPLDGVYYDWNVALLCCNPLHEGAKDGAAAAQGHWDIDELLDLMEWTRNRVGPNGLVIVHNTTTPMFAMENFSDHVVATEWGYSKWTDRAPDLQSLPLEWSLAGARSRGVISYGVLDSKSAPRLHRLFALEALLGGVSPWPASEEAVKLSSLLKPLGNMEGYQFADWRNQAVSLDNARCAAAVYSRPGEAFVLLANLEQSPREVTCVLHPEKLAHPIAQPTKAIRRNWVSSPQVSSRPPEAEALDARKLAGEGQKIVIPGDDAILIEVR